ncbi:site-2 protease family protein [Tersicoccus sp. MR15.9]|uniref:M50 family metallopeptidase n=1 Tax=Tersicoccus mangrovi TaxID=3121635 RepID=UPI002FE67772
MIVLLFVIGVVAVILGLAASIALHELGHLIPAKLFGVRVSQYMIGFGPTLVKIRRGETEYGIKAIPAGGYIAMAGMTPPVAPLPEGVKPSLFRRIADRARAAQSAEAKPGDEARSFWALPVHKRIVIMAGGPAMNLLIAVVLTGVLMVGIGTTRTTTTVGANPGPGTPAAAAGLRTGDRVTAFDGTPVTSWAQLSSMIRAHDATPTSITVQRDGTQVDLTVTPQLKDVAVLDEAGKPAARADGTPVTTRAGQIGVAFARERAPEPVTAVLPAVGETIVSIAGVVIALPVRLIQVATALVSPAPRDPNGPIGVLGVTRIAGEVAATDQIDRTSKAAGIIGILASMNAALFVFNLIPLLPLDGGHIAGALWEGLRRRTAAMFGRADPGPVDAAKAMPLTYLVAGLMLCMSVLLLIADIVKPVRLF